MFSRYSVRIVPFVDVFLMHLWGEVNSMSSYTSTILTLEMNFLEEKNYDEFQVTDFR